MDILRGSVGLLFLVGLAWLFSANRKAVSWPLVIKGLAFQIAIAVLILQVDAIQIGFEYLARGFVKVISFTDFGSDFLFSSFETGETAPGLLNFAFRVLPTIVFFSALSSLLYYIGVMQKVVYVFAWLMKHTLKLSGAESLAAAGNVFLGQTESPLLIKPYLDKMTRSEIMCLMTGGMATIAGGVLASYINFLGGDDPVQKTLFAKHLLTASIMSAPAAIVMAKILIPEKEKVDDSMSISKDKMGANVLEAITNGTTDGLKLAVNVGAMLLVFTALIYMGNWVLSDLIGSWTGLNQVIAENTPYEELSFQFILGYIGAPIAWMIGVHSEDIVLVGQLLGEKTILNEFYAYVTLGKMKDTEMFFSERSIIMATYVLAGFANFASIGIQIGGIGTLIPNRKDLLAKLGMRALLGGTLACLATAAIVGMMI